MPKLPSSIVKRLYLPSTTGAAEQDRIWVDVKTTLNVGDFLDLQDAKSDAERGLAGVAKAIVDWNITDDNDQKVPVTPDAIAQLTLSDFQFLAETINEDVLTQTKDAVSDEEKKT